MTLDGVTGEWALDMNASRIGRLALVLAPAACALLAVEIFGPIDAQGLFVALIAAAGAAAVVAHLLGRDFRRLAEYVQGLKEGSERPVSGLSADAESVVGPLRRLHRAARATLRQAADERAFDRAILEHLPAPVIVLDLQRRIEHLNDAASTLLGDDALGDELVRKIRAPEVMEAIDNAIEAGVAAEIEYGTTEATRRHFVGNVVPLVRDDGDVGGVALVLHDVTLLKQAEQMRADFVSDISHELRTPLSSLVGFIETLQGPARDDAEARAQFLAIMAEQAERMQALVQDLLSLSRIELNERVAPSGRVDLRELLQGVAAAMEPQSHNRNVRLDLRLPPNSGLSVAGDADQLSQVFANLIDNAIKYGGEHKTVSVTMSTRGGADDRTPAEAVVSVADQGPGIAKEHIPRLTERFYRVDTARSRALGGTGLGLAIVKHILNRHRGRLRIESELGKGSVFSVLLPLSRAERGAAAGAPE